MVSDAIHRLRCGSAALLLATVAGAALAEGGVTLMHVHGLSWSADGKRLLVPSHVGVAVYSAGRWTQAPGPENDYMGFSATRGALYSSGHPGPGTSLRNPFGLLKSRDGGKTWESLGLMGEADFHILAASYTASAIQLPTIYAYAPVANSRMPRPGVYHTSDDGKTWTMSAASGLSGRLAALAVHPARGNIVAAATESGLFLSEDYGDRFAAVAAGQATSAQFDLDGEHLWFGGYEGKATLTRLALKTRKLQAVPIPAIAKDAVAYIAQNPVDRRQYAIATFTRNVYLSNDGGKRWKPIAEHGQPR